MSSSWHQLRAEALGILRGEHVDLVLLDVTMPKIDGFEVCTRNGGKRQEDIRILSEN